MKISSWIYFNRLVDLVTFIMEMTASSYNSESRKYSSTSPPSFKKCIRCSNSAQNLFFNAREYTEPVALFASCCTSYIDDSDFCSERSVAKLCSVHIDARSSLLPSLRFLTVHQPAVLHLGLRWRRSNHPKLPLLAAECSWLRWCRRCAEVSCRKVWKPVCLPNLKGTWHLPLRGLQVLRPHKISYPSLPRPVKKKKIHIRNGYFALEWS